MASTDRPILSPGSMFIGQSMASTTINFELAIQKWFVEKDDYTYGKDYVEQLLETKICGYMIGHYTQVN